MESQIIQCKNPTQNELEVLGLTAMKIEQWKRKLQDIEKQDTVITNLLDKFAKDNNSLYCSIFKHFIECIDNRIKENNQLSRSNFFITKKLRQYIQFTLWEQMHKTNLDYEYIRKQQSLNICPSKYKYMDKCYRRAKLIEEGVNEIISNEELYNDLVSKMQTNDSQSIDHWLLEKLEVFQGEKRYFVDTVDTIQDEVNEITITYVDTENHVEVISAVKKFDNKILNQNPKLKETMMETIRSQIWDAGNIVDGGSGSCGLLGGVDGSMNHSSTLMCISHVYEASIGIGIDFGSGTGYLALAIAGITNWRMIGVEYNEFRYLQSLKTQKMLLENTTKQKNIAASNPNYSNVNFYYNGPIHDDSLSENLGQVRDFNLPNIDVIGLIYFFADGWTPRDVNSVVQIIKTNNNLKCLKYLLTDLKPKELKSHGISEGLISTKRLQNASLVRSSNSRAFYIYTYDATLPTIDTNKFKPKNIQELETQLSAWETYNAKCKSTRRDRHPVKRTELPNSGPRPSKRRATSSKMPTTPSQNKLNKLVEFVSKRKYPENVQTVNSKIDYFVAEEENKTSLSKVIDAVKSLSEDDCFTLMSFIQNQKFSSKKAFTPLLLEPCYTTNRTVASTFTEMADTKAQMEVTTKQGALLLHDTIEVIAKETEMHSSSNSGSSNSKDTVMVHEGDTAVKTELHSSSNSGSSSSSSSSSSSVHTGETEIMFEFQGRQILKRDYDSLSPEQWLTDNFIQYRVDLLNCRCRPKSENQYRYSTCCVHSGSVSVNTTQEEVYKWFQMFNDQTLLKSVQRIVWLVKRENNHWYFFYICTDSFRCFVVDSYKQKLEEYTQIVEIMFRHTKYCLEQYCPTKFDRNYVRILMKSHEIFFEDKCQQQSKGFDCGVFLCRGLVRTYYDIKGLQEKDVKHIVPGKYRKELLEEIKKHEYEIKYFSGRVGDDDIKDVANNDVISLVGDSDMLNEAEKNKKKKQKIGNNSNEACDGINLVAGGETINLVAGGEILIDEDPLGGETINLVAGGETLIDEDPFPLVFDFAGISLFAKDLKRLEKRMWLNDSIIASWMQHIKAQVNQICSTPLACCQSSGSYAVSLTNQQVVKWFKKFSVEQLSNIQYYIWIINVPNLHWYHIIIDIKDFKCHVCDSMSKEPSLYSNDVNIYLGHTKHMLEKRLPRKYTPAYVENLMQSHDIVVVNTFPQQTNGYDCGIFACMGIEHFYKAYNFDYNFNQNDVTNYREKMKKAYTEAFEKQQMKSIS